MVYSNGFGVKIITKNDQDKLQRGSYNYVALDNNTEYQLQLQNDRSTDAMAEIFVEGERVGTWFIPANKSISIDRPSDVARRFTFFSEIDSRAIGAGVVPGRELNGVVRVIFYPKKSDYISISPSRRIMTSEGSPYAGITLPPLSPRGMTSPVLSPRGIIPEGLPYAGMTSPTLSPRGSSAQQIATPAMSSRAVTSTGYQSGATVLGRQSNQTYGSMKRFTNDEIDWPNKTEIIIRLIVKPAEGRIISTVESSSGNVREKQFISVKDTDIEPIPPRVGGFIPLIDDIF